MKNKEEIGKKGEITRKEENKFETIKKKEREMKTSVWVSNTLR